VASLPVALTIAGSDSGGGAGIQADLKTFAALGVFGTSALTAITAQNTVGVTAVEAVSPAMVRAQIDAVVTDLAPRAAKTGMLATRPIVEAVAEAMSAHGLPRVVVDPVMVSKSGHRLLDDEAVDAVVTHLLPLSGVVTPNAEEAAVLTGRQVRSLDEARDAARRLLDLGARAVVLKGGHLPTDDVVDLLVTTDAVVELRGPRHPGRNTHGTGCTFAAAMAAMLARDADLETAFREARGYVDGAIRHAPSLGAGDGPLHHFWRVY
jgi:hydroxymethylpyrimidine/phosphomethylpyrimidine kinase